ncbi:hypothetical protein ACFL03_15600 [Thermodesulfobacteriota bacterium]
MLNKMILNNHSTDRLIGPICIELTEKEINKINIRALANYLLNRTLVLSHAVNAEILEPISLWLDDPNFMEKFRINIEDQAPNWKEYKRKQRQRTQQQKMLATERLKLYWQEIRKKRNFRKELSSILGGKTQSQFCTDTLTHKKAIIDEKFLSSIIAPFSPIEQHRRETIHQFKKARTMAISNLLPWKLLLSTELTSAKHFKNLKTYCSAKKDKVSKLMHLLQMETDGEVKLSQDNPFSDIIIEPLDVELEQSITIKDQNGQEYHFDWRELSDNQRNKIVSDMMANRILCKTA